MTSVAVKLDPVPSAALLLDDLLPLCAEALPAAERLWRVRAHRCWGS